MENAFEIIIIYSGNLFLYDIIIGYLQVESQHYNNLITFLFMHVNLHFLYILYTFCTQFFLLMLALHQLKSVRKPNASCISNSASENMDKVHSKAFHITIFQHVFTDCHSFYFLKLFCYTI